MISGDHRLSAPRWQPSYFLSLSTRLSMNDIISESSKLNNNPHQKLSILNPSTNLLASKTINAFITNKKRPSVNIVTGSVSKISIGFAITLRIARTTAKMMAVQKSVTCTPLRIFASPKDTAAITRILSRKFMINERY